MKMRHVSLRGILLCAGTVMVTGAQGTDIFVSPSGNDGNSGSMSAPLATLTAARDKADQLKTATTGVRVFLRGGTYYLSAPLVFGPSNSGTAAAPIRYVAYGTEKPVVSGGIKVTSNWTTSTGQIMVTTIATGLKVDGLFLNGKRQILARYPNFDPTQVVLNGYVFPSYSRGCPVQAPLGRGFSGGSRTFTAGKISRCSLTRVHWDSISTGPTSPLT
jgi:hypothetical protein